jgi:biopolymer transport protein ExbD
MSIEVPKRRKYFKPIGFLRAHAHGGKKSVSAELNLTAMVDMFTVIVIFLLQSFSANGEIMVVAEGLTMPEAANSAELNERGAVVTLLDDKVLLEGVEMATLSEMDPADVRIPALVEKLTQMRELDEKLKSAQGKPRNPNEPYDGSVIIQADEDVDFILVRKALASLNEAGYAKIKFAVMGVIAEGGEAKEE